MLRAIVRGKKRGSGLEHSIPHVGQFAGAEDLLTASVFGRLMYYSDTRLAEIFGSLPGMSEIWPGDFGSLESFEFWPRFQAPDGRVVEPDAVIATTDAIFVIEAKRFDGIRQQNSDQLRRQRDAVVCDESYGEKPIIQIAIGGNLRTTAPEADGFNDLNQSLCRVHWSDLLSCVLQLPNPSESERRLAADIALAFDLHGISRTDFALSRITVAGIVFERFPPLPPERPINSQQRPLLPLLKVGIKHSRIVGLSNEFRIIRSG